MWDCCTADWPRKLAEIFATHPRVGVAHLRKAFLFLYAAIFFEVFLLMDGRQSGGRSVVRTACVLIGLSNNFVDYDWLTMIEGGSYRFIYM